NSSLDKHKTKLDAFAAEGGKNATSVKYLIQAFSNVSHKHLKELEKINIDLLLSQLSNDQYIETMQGLAALSPTEKETFFDIVFQNRRVNTLPDFPRIYDNFESKRLGLMRQFPGFVNSIYQDKSAPDESVATYLKRHM